MLTHTGWGPGTIRCTSAQFWGLPTKILWLVTCVILMTLDVVAASPVRPARTAPQRDRCPPRWLVVTVTATSILLPVLGLSVVVLLVGEQLVARLRKQ